MAFFQTVKRFFPGVVHIFNREPAAPEADANKRE
jgi:hypothetical protein